MPGHIEVETEELREKIDEIGEEQEREEKREKWLGYVGLSTAILAVVAAVSALQSSTLINEALILQIKASDTWNQYQAARMKDHTYTIAVNGLADANANNPRLAAVLAQPAATEKPAAEGKAPAENKEPAPEKPAAAEHKPGKKEEPVHTAVTTAFAIKSAADRASEYRSNIAHESSKEANLMHEATALENESEEDIHRHHRFEYAVALIQVAIALAAISALIRRRPVWYVSMLSGAVGVAFFVMGWLAL